MENSLMKGDEYNHFRTITYEKLITRKPIAFLAVEKRNAYRINRTNLKDFFTFNSIAILFCIFQDRSYLNLRFHFSVKKP